MNFFQCRSVISDATPKSPSRSSRQLHVLWPRRLRESLIVREEENEEHCKSRWERDAGNHVDGLGHTNRVRWFFFSYLKNTAGQKWISSVSHAQLEISTLVINCRLTTTSGPHPLFAGCVHVPGPHCVQATMSFGPPGSRLLSVCKANFISLKVCQVFLVFFFFKGFFASVLGGNSSSKDWKWSIRAKTYLNLRRIRNRDVWKMLVKSELRFKYLSKSSFLARDFFFNCVFRNESVQWRI